MSKEDMGRESAVRRRAEQCGFLLVRAHKEATNSDDQDSYMLRDVETGWPACGYSCGASLEEIAGYLDHPWLRKADGHRKTRLARDFLNHRARQGKIKIGIDGGNLSITFIGSP